MGFLPIAETAWAKKPDCKEPPDAAGVTAMADNTTPIALPGSPPRGWSSFPAIRKNGHRCSRAGKRSAATTPPPSLAGGRKWPGRVPALDLARCGLVVLDGDRHHAGVDGVAALRELLRQQPGLDVKALPMVKTPRDGVHVYLRNAGRR